MSTWKYSFQSTPSVWRETEQSEILMRIVEEFQSTPSVWRETNDRFFLCVRIDISIHSLRMEGDSIKPAQWVSISNFNPLPPYGGRRYTRQETNGSLTFQSTPSVWRETQCLCVKTERSKHFNPLPPYGGRRIVKYNTMMDDGISIHSLRMEGDRLR